MTSPDHNRPNEAGPRHGSLSGKEHRSNVEELAENLVYILTNPACPEKLHNAIMDALSEIETQSETVSVDFLRGSSFHHCAWRRRCRMRHIKQPVTIPPDKAEKLYIATHAVQELAELMHTGEAARAQSLLRILGEQFSEGLSDVSFPFED